MMPLSNSPKASSSKKRRLAGQDPNRPAKQSKINSYCPPLHPISPDLGVGDSEWLLLNEEQKKVFRMVVNEGKMYFSLELQVCGPSAFIIPDFPP